MHSLDLSVLARLVIGRDIRTEYMLPPDEISQRSPPGCQPARRRRPSVTASSAATTSWRPDWRLELGDRVRLGAVVQSIDADEGGSR